MPKHDSPGETSTTQRGGVIPGTAGKSAFSIQRKSPSPIPVVVAVPHAGRSYPRSLLDRMRDPDAAGVRLEDRYVDLLAERIAEQTGACLIVAHAPRAMIDLNRAPEDMDWDMLAEGAPGNQVLRAGRRARGGLGLVPRRLPGMGDIWRTRLPRQELDARLAGVHAPYHAALATELASLRSRWGCALLVDLHSMPPLAPRRGAAGHADFVVGDRFGSSCDGALSAAAFAHFASSGHRAAHNRPYAGGYILDRHCAPARGIHGLQLEICRTLYLDASLREPTPAVGEVAGYLAALVRHLADELAALGKTYRQAAE